MTKQKTLINVLLDKLNVTDAAKVPVYDPDQIQDGFGVVTAEIGRIEPVNPGLPDYRVTVSIMGQTFSADDPDRGKFQTLAEAKQYAHENYRGLYRASWGLGFKKIQKQPPPAFNKYAARRPDLRKTALKLNRFRYDTNTDTLFITNEAIPAGESFVNFMDTAASSAALKTMNRRIAALMKRKYDL